MSLNDRIARLEKARMDGTAEPLTEHARQQLERWPEIMLERYCEGRLDDLAGMSTLPIAELLKGLQDDGFAIKFDGRWHPLFIGNDEFVNAHVLARVFELIEEKPGFRAASASVINRRARHEPA